MIDTREARAAASEVKFVVPEALGYRVRDWARRHLTPDPHGTGPFGDEYQTTTLYFDTAERDVFYQRGSYGRAKYRVRRYADYDFVFLERKLRRPGLLIKRRTQVPLDALERFRYEGARGPWLADWFERRIVARNLSPACQLVYQRMARGYETDTGLARLTVDGGLGASPVTAVAFSTLDPVSALDGQMIVEMKFRGPVPSMFKGLVEEFGLSPRAVSKYRLGVAALTGLPIVDVAATTEKAVRV
jgi:hypothetical protein